MPNVTKYDSQIMLKEYGNRILGIENSYSLITEKLSKIERDNYALIEDKIDNALVEKLKNQNLSELKITTSQIKSVFSDNRNKQIFTEHLAELIRNDKKIEAEILKATTGKKLTVKQKDEIVAEILKQQKEKEKNIAIRDVLSNAEKSRLNSTYNVSNVFNKEIIGEQFSFKDLKSLRTKTELTVKEIRDMVDDENRNNFNSVTQKTLDSIRKTSDLNLKMNSKVFDAYERIKEIPFFGKLISKVAPEEQVFEDYFKFQLDKKYKLNAMFNSTMTDELEYEAEVELSKQRLKELQEQYNDEINIAKENNKELRSENIENQKLVVELAPKLKMLKEIADLEKRKEDGEDVIVPEVIEELNLSKDDLYRKLAEMQKQYDDAKTAIEYNKNEIKNNNALIETKSKELVKADETHKKNLERLDKKYKKVTGKLRRLVMRSELGAVMLVSGVSKLINVVIDVLLGNTKMSKEEFFNLDVNSQTRLAYSTLTERQQKMLVDVYKFKTTGNQSIADFTGIGQDKFGSNDWDVIKSVYDKSTIDKVHSIQMGQMTGKIKTPQQLEEERLKRVEQAEYYNQILQEHHDEKTLNKIKKDVTEINNVIIDNRNVEGNTFSSSNTPKPIFRMTNTSNTITRLSE